MADDYDYDGDGFMDAYDDEWMYVEDEFGLADELAETQIADPGYAGTNNELEMETYEYDLYGYWDELEYADDQYWEVEGRRAGQAVDVKAGSKRKRPTSKRAVHTSDKKQKVSETSSAPANVQPAPLQPVCFQSRLRRLEDLKRRAPVLKDGTVFALLPDWRERFADDEGTLGDSKMPVAMLHAARATEEDTPERVKSRDPALTDMDDEGWEDDEEGEEEDAEAGMDQEALKTILKQRLGEAGLEGIDESAFMATISKMLAGEDGAEEAAGDLANSLLGKATGGDTSISGWLSQEGVSLDKVHEEDDNDTSSVATPELPSGPSLQVSPSDSVIGSSGSPPQRSSGGRTRELVLHPSSPERQLQEPPTDEIMIKKGGNSKKVTFDVPSSSAASAHTNDFTVDDGAASDTENALPPPSSSDPLTSASTVRTKQARKSPAKVTQTEANESSTTATNDKPARQTRKRKAASNEANAQNTGPSTKRTRGTRSTA